jgi:hypothetical protein
MRELALKILKEETGGFEEQSRLRDDVLDAMLRFVDETKQLTIPAVVGRSEQLKCGNQNPPCAPNLKFGMLECCNCNWSE